MNKKYIISYLVIAILAAFWLDVMEPKCRNDGQRSFWITTTFNALVWPVIIPAKMIVLTFDKKDLSKINPHVWGKC